MKRCIECGTVKPYEFYSIDTRYNGGYNSWCKQCHSDYFKDWKKRGNKGRVTGTRDRAVTPSQMVKDALQDRGLTLHLDRIREIEALVRCGVDVRQAIQSVCDQLIARLKVSKEKKKTDQEKWDEWLMHERERVAVELHQKKMARKQA